MRPLFLTILLLCTTLITSAFEPLSSRDAGIYMHPTLDHSLSLLILRLNLSKETNEKAVENFWQMVNKYAENKKKVVWQLNLIADPERKGKIPSIAFAKQQLAPYFQSKLARPELIYGVVAEEENVYWNGERERLNAIYDYLHNECKLRVWQWLTEPYAPRLDFKADAWIFDAYSIPTRQFYIHCEKFILTGKPVIPILWASGHFDNYFKDKDFDWLTEFTLTRSSYCTSLGLPVMFFCVTAPLGSVNDWIYGKPADQADRQYRDKLLAYLKSLATQEKSPKIEPPIKKLPLPIHSNGQNKTELVFGNNFTIANYTTFDNPANWMLDQKALSLRGKSGKLSWTPVPRGKIGRIEASIHYQLKGKGILRYGNQEYPLKDGTHTFQKTWDKIDTLALDVSGEFALTKLSFSYQGEIEYKPLVMYENSFKDDFSGSEFISSLSSTQFPKEFNIIPQKVSLQGKAGHASKVELIQQIQIPPNTNSIIIIADVTADKANYGGHIAIECGDSKVETMPSNKKQKLRLQINNNNNQTTIKIKWTMSVNCGIATPNRTPAVIHNYTIEAK